MARCGTAGGEARRCTAAAAGPSASPRPSRAAPQRCSRQLPRRRRKAEAITPLSQAPRQCGPHGHCCTARRRARSYLSRIGPRQRSHSAIGTAISSFLLSWLLVGQLTASAALARRVSSKTGFKQSGRAAAAEGRVIVPGRCSKEEAETKRKRASESNIFEEKRTAAALSPVELQPHRSCAARLALH